ncbi:hypothetical protein KCP76_09295 [Salmonella enterica subsp. enterica serovar Weltevreden]|nr:hypothetical protein KCP76_09295 [Salmonella enterica subsp. enterica serovar Weltevreden]
MTRATRKSMSRFRERCRYQRRGRCLLSAVSRAHYVQSGDVKPPHEPSSLPLSVESTPNLSAY